MNLVAYYALYNEADYLEYSLKSIYQYVDEIIVIEGCWLEAFRPAGSLRSNDGSLEILKNFPDPQNKISVYFHNEQDQLAQRNVLWNYINGSAMCLLVDGDEVFDEENIRKVRHLSDTWDKNEDACFYIQSNIFVNDLYMNSTVLYPRLWTIKDNKSYQFVEPNTILVDGKPFNFYKTDIQHWHYAYVKSPQRFIMKKHERIMKHNKFAWNIDRTTSLIYREDAKIEPYEGKHPEVMKGHPLYGVRRHKDVGQKEIICLSSYSGLGNVIHTTPALKALRELKPDAQIYLMTHLRCSRILEGWDILDGVVLGNQGDFAASLKRNIGHLLVVPAGGLVHPYTREHSNNILETNVGIWGKHESEYIFDYARKLGYRGEMPHTTVIIFDYNIQNALSIITKNGLQTGNFLCIGATYLHKGHWKMKHWGDQNYIDLINSLDMPCVLVGSEEDIQCEEIANKTGAINMCGWSRDIKDTAALIQLSKRYIGNDGGLAHIASALDVPSVVIFTFTNPIKNRPMHKCKLVMTPCKDRISCQHGNYKKCLEKGCLDIQVEKVLEKVYETL